MEPIWLGESRHGSMNQMLGGCHHFEIDKLGISLVTQSCPTLCSLMDCSRPGFSVQHQLLELAQTHVHRVGDASNHLILCRPLLLLPSIFSSIRIFSNESVLRIRWPKDWSFSFSISPSKDYSGLISFRMDWFNLLSVQGTLQESSPTPQFKSINSSTLSFLYGPTLTSIHDNWKTTALIRWTFVDKLMSLLFNMLSRLVITFLPRSKCLLISWLQSPSAVILEPKKIKPITVSTVSPSICPEVMGPDAMILVQKVNLMLLWEMGPLSCPG